MRKQIICVLFVIIMILGLLGGCSKAGDTTTSLPDQATHSELIDKNDAFSDAISQSDMTFDKLWSTLEGTWQLKEYIYIGKVTNYSDHDLKFYYINNEPCMSREYQGNQPYSHDVVFYELVSIDELHCEAYTYKRGSYGGEGANWSNDVRSVWWSFDLSNLSNGELSLTYTIATDNGLIDNYNTFIYWQN